MDGVRVEWTWDAASSTYLRSQDGQPHVAVSGARIAADNVVELATTYIPSPVDARSPNPITVGSGIAVVHRDGMAIPATWSRATVRPVPLHHAAPTNRSRSTPARPSSSSNAADQLGDRVRLSGADRAIA